MAVEGVLPTPGQPLHILAICGSLNPNGVTHQALELACKGAEELGARTSVLALQDYQLVFYGEAAEKDYPADVTQLRNEIKQADGLIIGTPEYHGSMSGSLKNMLDLLSHEQLEGKIVGLAKGQWALRVSQSSRDLCRVTRAG